MADCNVGVQIGAPPMASYEPMTLKNHKRLTDLAYSVKAFIDAHGGLNHDEACQFGQLMSSIIHLK